jgi:hypothetical protein
MRRRVSFRLSNPPRIYPHFTKKVLTNSFLNVLTTTLVRDFDGEVAKKQESKKQEPKKQELKRKGI